MLLRNRDQSEGLCNGTRLIITRMAEHVLEAKNYLRKEHRQYDLHSKVGHVSFSITLAI